MNKFGKITCLTLGAVMSLGFACACGEAGDGDSANKGEQKVFVIWCPEADHEFAKQVADDFLKENKDLNLKFQFGIQGENDAATKVLTDVENAPDVFSFSSDQINKLIVGDALARIGGERLDRIKAQNTAESIDSATVTVGGAEMTYAFPYTDNTFFLYYNKSKFTENDVKTLDGILAKCSATEQFGYPMNDGWYNSAFFFGKGLGYEVEFSDQLAENKVTTDFGNEVGQQVAEAMWQYVQNPAFKADSDDSKLISGFQTGKIIAGVSGIWNKTSIQKYLGEDFGVAKLPTYTLGTEQVQLTAFAGYKLLGVSKHSPNLVVAQQFAEFYTNKANQIKHFEARGYLPTDKEAQTDSRITSDACALAIKEQLVYTKTQKGVPTTLWTPMQGFGDAMITAAGKGEEFDVQKQLAAAVTAINK